MKYNQKIPTKSVNIKKIKKQEEHLGVISQHTV